jgi:tight adherence protein B
MASDLRSVVVMALLGFMLAVAAATMGVLAVVRLAYGRAALPALRMGSNIDRRKMRQAAGAMAVGFAALLLTRWPLAGLSAAAVVVLWPRLFGGGASGRHQLERIEALASWTESLRDTASAAAGLEQAIPATVGAAHALLRAPVRELAARLDGRVALPEALARFADDINDPAADMVVAALSLNARQRAGGLERILTSLASSSRAELEMRRKVELERRLLRRQAQRIAVAVLGFIALQAIFARGWVEPYSTAFGQCALAALAVIFLGAFARMRKLSESEPEPRFLTNPDQVTEIASYRSGLSSVGSRP